MANPADDDDNDNDGVCQREEFNLPSARTVGAVGLSDHQLDAPSVYFAGHSLGAVSRTSQALVQEEIAVWAASAVEGHFDHPHGRPWATFMDSIHPLLADIVGAQESEVACMGSLTSNLHLLMNLFYKPSATRYKILCEANAFPSDEYAFSSQAGLHGLDPATAVVRMRPRRGEYILREEDITDLIAREGHSIALVLFSGVQYYTGQLFPIERITRAGQEQGCIVGWDLAHAVGNIPLSLHDWGVDFAVWCSYKYLNAGPGAIGGLFMHDKWADVTKPKHAGWWGHDQHTRFQMPPQFAPIRGAHGLQQSNPDILGAASLLGSLRVFARAGGVNALRQRSMKLTARLEERLRASRFYVAPEDAASNASGSQQLTFTIITPSDPAARGAQLSLRINPPGVFDTLFAGLRRRGVLGDERRPDAIRLTPVPLYCTSGDCDRAAVALEEALEEVRTNMEHGEGRT